MAAAAAGPPALPPLPDFQDRPGGLYLLVPGELSGLVSAGLRSQAPGQRATGAEGLDAILNGAPEEPPGDAGQAVAGPQGPEIFKAGRWDRARGKGAGFASGGMTDNLPPGPTLAGLAGDVWDRGLERLSDDELIGVLRAARRLTSWACAMELAAAGDLWRRRMKEEEAGDAGACEHTGDEIAAALTLTGRSADQLLDLAIGLRRLPMTSAALAAGDIDVPRAMVIAQELAGLADEHAAAIERAVLGAAARQTTGQLRRATHRAVLATDPAAARQRKEQAERGARVERWTEPAGTAALAGRDLPPAAVLAADANLTALAKQLKAAGAEDTMDALRAKIYLALLTGTPVTSLLPTAGSATAAGSPSDFPGLRDDFPGLRDDFPGLRGGRISGRVNLTLPLSTWLGRSDAPGYAAGYGPLDATDSRTVADAMAAQADSKWCLTLTDANGTSIAHGCARARPVTAAQPGCEGPRGSPASHSAPARPPASPDGPASHSLPASPGKPASHSLPASPGKPASHSPPASPDTPAAHSPPDTLAALAPATWTFTVSLLERDPCRHARQTAAYRPPPALRHLIEIRQATCTFPGCLRPATRCDKDHTVPYHLGGRTCECNLAPLCRHHHEAKQAHGWTLEQRSPGVMIWTTPAGRRYTVSPMRYPS